MRNRVERTGLRWLPVLAAGSFAGRVLSEAFRPGLWGALTITLLCLLAAGVLLLLRLRSELAAPSDPFTAKDRQLPLFLSLPLAVYLVYPEANPGVAAMALAVAAMLWLLHVLSGGPAAAQVGGWARQLTIVAGVLVSAAFLWLYAVTLAPDLLPADNGEFQLVSTTLGVAHPPGYPLYTMLAHLATLLPFGSTPAYRVNLFSALTSTLTLILTFGAAHRLTGNRLASLLAVLALGTATTFWSQATTANIRSMTALFAALALFALAVIDQSTGKRAEKVNEQPPATGPQWAYYLLALALGFGVTHHASLVFLAAVSALYVLLVDPAFVRAPRRWLPVLLVSLLGLLPLLYIPWRAGSGAAGAAPELATMAGFVEHVLALGFRGDFLYFTTPAELWQRLLIMLNVLLTQYSPWLLLGALAGWLLLWRRRWQLALLLGGFFALHTLMTAIYRAPQTVEYMLPAYLPIAICLGIGVSELLSARPSLAVAGRFVVALLILVAVLQGITRWPSFRQLHADFTARDYANSLLQPAPENGLLLSDWHWVTPIWYLQQVEGERADLLVQYVFPEGEPYADTWAGRIASGLESGLDVIATHYEATAFAGLAAPEPLGEANWFRQSPRNELPSDFIPLDIVLGEALQISGYRLESDLMTPGVETTLTLAWQPVEAAEGGLSTFTLFAHLTGPDGRVYAQADVPAQTPPAGLALTQLHLTPRLETLPGDYTVYFGAYNPVDAAPLPNAAGESRSQLTGVTVNSMAAPPFTHGQSNRPLAESGDMFLRLVGYDWDNTLSGRSLLYRHWQTVDGYVTERVQVDGDGAPMPDWYGPWGLVLRGTTMRPNREQYYVPLGQGIIYTAEPPLAGIDLAAGSSVTLPAHFASSAPVLRDLVVSVRLVGYEPDGFHWAWWDLHDSIPALGAIPTLKWIAGTRVRDPHPLRASEEAESGQEVGGILMLYDAFTARLLPILDAEISAELLGIPLGTTTIKE